MEKVYIIGHQKPDTDAITSAISLSYLKNQLGMNTIPARIGDVNKETQYALNYFNVRTPILIEDVKLQLKDINYHKDYFLNYHSSINDAYNYMLEKGITGVPIVDDRGKFISLITLKMMIKDIISGNIYRLNTSYKNIINTLNGEQILKFDEEIKGSLLSASYRSTTFLDTVSLTPDNILIVGDRHSLIEYAVNCGIKLIILVGNGEIKENHLEQAREKHVNIIRTSYDTFKTSKLIGLSNYISNIIPDEIPYTFNELCYYDDFKYRSSKLKHNNYPVIGKNNVCKGLLRITDIVDVNRKKVILVDHNEIDQSVDGLDEAEIIEIVDHHKIGNISTKNPINFRNMSVGSTNTIVYEMYKENQVNIPQNIAGIMLSGIISDTLVLTSPTTTAYDKRAVKELSVIAGVDYHKYALDMFKYGTSLEGETIEEIVETDIKAFNADDKSFAISQVFTLDIDSIISKKDEYINHINKIAKEKNYSLVLLVITDIIRNGSYFLFTENGREIVCDAFDFLDVDQGFYISGIVSRKKQIVPKIMDVIR